MVLGSECGSAKSPDTFYNQRDQELCLPARPLTETFDREERALCRVISDCSKSETYLVVGHSTSKVKLQEKGTSGTSVPCYWV